MRLYISGLACAASSSISSSSSSSSLSDLHGGGGRLKVYARHLAHDGDLVRLEELCNEFLGPISDKEPRLVMVFIIFSIDMTMDNYDLKHN